MREKKIEEKLTCKYLDKFKKKKIKNCEKNAIFFMEGYNTS